MPKKTANGSEILPRIQEFYRFMVENKLEALEYDHQGLRVRLVRQRPAQIPVPVPVPVGGAPAGAAPAPGTASPAGPAGDPLPPNAAIIKSPMMGIFYRAASPSSPPFVKKGDLIKKGHVLCLIEAMKVFNEVKAEFDCVIHTLFLENGKPVKAGQDIFIAERK